MAITEHRDKLQKVLADMGGVGDLKETEIQFKWDTNPEANQLLKSVRQKQRELRQIKKEMNAEMKAIRVVYKSKSASVNPGCFSVFMGKGAQRSDVAAQRQQLREEQAKEFAPYEDLKLAIDKFLLQLDGVKIEVENWLGDQK